MNKPRLIDANELVIETKKCLSLCETFKGYTAEEALKHFLLLINEQPTAYDVDKVVEQLEALPNINQNYHSITEMIDREDAIEIVKGNCCKNGNSSDQFTDVDKMGGGAECVVDVNKTLEGGANNG